MTKEKNGDMTSGAASKHTGLKMSNELVAKMAKQVVDDFMKKLVFPSDNLICFFQHFPTVVF